MMEVKVYKQKVKHLLYEHQNNVAQLKEASEMALKLQQEEHRGREAATQPPMAQTRLTTQTDSTKRHSTKALVLVGGEVPEPPRWLFLPRIRLDFEESSKC